MTNKTIYLLVAAFFGLLTPTCFANADTQSNPEQNITAGVGLSACPIGCDKDQFVSLFSEAQSLGSSVQVPNRGIEANVKRGRIAVVFFYFNTKRMTESNARTGLMGKVVASNNAYSGRKSDFSGKTNTGIGAHSSIDDVIKKYGTPVEYLEGPGPYGKGEEITLGYSSKGIIFTFLNNRLIDIRIFSPPHTPSRLSTKELRERIVGEWQLNLHSGNQRLPFKEGFLTGVLGPVLTLSSDGTASYTIPCDINAKLNTKFQLKGQWRLSEEGSFSLPLQLEGTEFAINGQLEFDEQSDDIDHLVFTQAKDKSTKFGRFNRSLLNCD